jgi:hypothetical protein
MPLRQHALATIVLKTLIYSLAKPAAACVARIADRYWTTVQ